MYSLLSLKDLQNLIQQLFVAYLVLTWLVAQGLVTTARTAEQKDSGQPKAADKPPPRNTSTTRTRQNG